MSIILNSFGRPVPPLEINKRLKQVHPRLGLMFVEGIASHWAITMEWAEDDRRREGIRKGDTDPFRAIDIVGYLPMDCSLDEAPSLISQKLRAFPKEEVSKIANRMMMYNKEPAKEAVEQAIAEVLDRPDPSRDTGVKTMVDVKADLTSSGDEPRQKRKYTKRQR